MDDAQQVLLDLPKKAHLLGQSTELRVALKNFERTFAERNGRSGKLAYEALDETKPRRKSKRGTHNRQDSGIGSSPRKQQRNMHGTPRKSTHPFELDPYDAPGSASPKPVLMNTIGPTPHRDGKVLGLFDLLQRSGSGKSSAATLSSSAKKRKIDELYDDSPAGRSPLKVIQAPSHRSGRKQGDLLHGLEENGLAHISRNMSILA